MNKKFWRKQARSYKVPVRGYHSFIFKLMEEVGEVGNAILEKGEDDVIEELDHVIFIAKQAQHAIRNYKGEA